MLYSRWVGIIQVSTLQDSSLHVLSLPAPQAGLLGTLRQFASILVVRALPPQAAMPAPPECASRRRRRGVLSSYQEEMTT